MEWDRLVHTKFQAEIANKRDHLGNLGRRISDFEKMWYGDVVGVLLVRAKLKLRVLVKKIMKNLLP
jgi:hypothetical protein